MVRDLYFSFKKVVETIVFTLRIIPCSMYQSAAFTLKTVVHTNTHSTHTQACSHILNICPLRTWARSGWMYGKAMQGNRCRLKYFPNISPHSFLVVSFKCTHLQTGCSASECCFVPVRLHGNSTLLKISEAGSNIPDIPAPSGPEETAGGKAAEGADGTLGVFMEQGSRLHHSTDNQRR